MYCRTSRISSSNVSSSNRHDDIVVWALMLFRLRVFFSFFSGALQNQFAWDIETRLSWRHNQIPAWKKKKKNNPRNHSGYITECIGTEFGRTQPSGCTSLNTPIPWHVCHRPPPPQQRLFCSAGLHRDSDLWPHRRRGTVELCRCHSVTTRTSGLALNGCDSVVDFCHPAHHA